MSMYTVGHSDKNHGIMSPVPPNVQPDLTLSGTPGPADYVNQRGNLNPAIMSTPGNHSASHHNVRIGSLPPSHHQSPSVNSTDLTRTPNHIFAPHTVPSNGFAAAPQLNGATHPQVTVPSSIPSVPSSVPSGPAGGPAQHPHHNPHANAADGSAATTPSAATTSTPVPAPAALSSSRRKTSSKAGRRGATSAASRRATRRASPAVKYPAPTRSTQSPERDDSRSLVVARTQAPPQGAQANDVNPSNDSPPDPNQVTSLAQFAPNPDVLSTPTGAGLSLPSLNTTLNSSFAMAPSPAPPQSANSGTGGPGGGGHASHSQGQLLPPPEGIYRSFEELLRAVQQMAKDQGYGVVKLRASNYRDGKPTRYDLVCDRGGVKYSSTAKKRNPSTRKVDCPWRAKAVCEVQLGNQWRFQVQDARHNHEPRIQAAMPGVEQTSTNQYLRTISNKVDRMSHDISAVLGKIENHLEAMDKRIEGIEDRIGNVDARLNTMESNRMDMDMDVERGLLASSSIMPASQQPEGQAGQGQMASAFAYPGA